MTRYLGDCVTSAMTQCGRAILPIFSFNPREDIMKAVVKEFCVFIGFSLFGALCFLPLFVAHMIAL